MRQRDGTDGGGTDYCDIFLTHDAPRVRKDHNAGWKHAAQVRAHYLGRKPSAPPLLHLGRGGRTRIVMLLRGDKDTNYGYIAVNPDKMQRTIAEIVKDYEARRELVPVPAPMMMRPPPGTKSHSGPFIPGSSRHAAALRLDQLTLS